MSRQEYADVSYVAACLNLIIGCYGDGSGLLRSVDPVAVLTVIEDCKKKLDNVILGE